MEFFRKEYWSGLPFHSPGRKSMVRAKNKDLQCLSTLLRKMVMNTKGRANRFKGHQRRESWNWYEFWHDIDMNWCEFWCWPLPVVPFSLLLPTFNLHAFLKPSNNSTSLKSLCVRSLAFIEISHCPGIRFCFFEADSGIANGAGDQGWGVEGSRSGEKLCSSQLWTQREGGCWVLSVCWISQISRGLEESWARSLSFTWSQESVGRREQMAASGTFGMGVSLWMTIYLSRR